MSNHFRLFMQYLILNFAALWLCPSYSETIPSAPLVTPPLTLASKNVTLLQNELNHYQNAVQQPWVPLTLESKLKLGKKNSSVPLLRQRLQIAGDLNNENPNDNSIYDAQVAHAVKHFQYRHALEADGIIGKATLAELNIPPEQRIKTLQINLQRWSDLAKKLGNRFIIVNIPDFALYLFDQGNQVMMMKTIVGKPDLQTPELNSRITRIIFNPYWHVPDKIAARDIIPKLRKDPYYLDDMHIKVYVKDSDHTEQVSGNDVDWQRTQGDDLSYEFRQEPGEDNALGVVKFEFPNSYSVYLHDTPVKTLFEQPYRALSHGCIRLENPLDLVNYLIQDNTEWNSDRIDTVIDSHQTTNIRIIKPIPIYITYITAWADENGVVNYRNDIYNKDL